MSVHRRLTKRRGAVYDVRLRTPDGHPYKRTFRTKREAEAFEARELADRSRGTWLDPRRAEITFGEWVNTYQANPGSRRASTLARNDDAIRLHLVPAFGTRPLGTLTPLDVQHLVNALAQRFAPATVRTYYAVLRAILNAALNADLIARSPCRGIKLPAPHGRLRRVAEPAEVHELADHIDQTYRPMVYVAMELGLRWGECAGLQVGDLDFLRRTVAVVRNVGEVRGVLIVGSPKTRAGIRTLAASEPLMAELAAHLSRRGQTGKDSNGWLFPAPAGGPLSYTHFRSRVWRPAVRAAGLDGLTFHGLRHSAATWWVAAGIDARTAQHRLGHSTPRLVLELYAHATTSADRAAAELLGTTLYPHADAQDREILAERPAPSAP